MSKEAQDFKASGQGPQKSATLSNRIVSSAQGLLGDAISGSKSDAISTYSSSLASDQKASSSSSTSSASVSSESSFGLQHGTANIIKYSDDSPKQTFRSIRPGQHDIEPFTYGETDFSPVAYNRLDDVEQGEMPTEYSGRKGKGVATQTSAAPVPQGMRWISQYQQPEEASRMFDLEQDGSQVTQLLSDPSFQPSFWLDNESIEEVPPKISVEEEELAGLFNDRLKEAGLAQQSTDLPGPSDSQTSFLAKRLESVLTTVGDQEELKDLDTFFADLRNYHEKVWGYAQPLIQQVREEVRQAELGTSPDGPGLRRLRMLLAHLEP